MILYFLRQANFLLSTQGICCAKNDKSRCSANHSISNTAALCITKCDIGVPKKLATDNPCQLAWTSGVDPVATKYHEEVDFPYLIYLLECH